LRHCHKSMIVVTARDRHRVGPLYSSGGWA
jgi:hypothetical protein